MQIIKTLLWMGRGNNSKLKICNTAAINKLLRQAMT